MIDINELRRKVNSTDIVDHIDLHANIKPFLSELLDRLEAAEKEGDTMRTKISDLTINAEYLGNLKKSYEELIGELQDDRDALRAKIERMEQQEPVSWADAFGEPFRKKSEIDGVASPLYALPGAKGE